MIDKDTLLKDVEELGYTGTGRKYGVSDNAVRKWIKCTFNSVVKSTKLISSESVVQFHQGVQK